MKPESSSWLPTGTVYGTLLNSRAEFEALRPQMDAMPHKAPPREPVLYVKTANTWSTNGATVPVPGHVPEVEIGATLGMVIGDSIGNGDTAGAVTHYVLLNDFSVPHASFFRPPVRFKCLDGFLGVGSPVDAASVDAASVDPAQVTIEVRVNGNLVQTVRFDALMRDAATLLADVGAFMTLLPGDVLTLGCNVLENGKRPLAKPGDVIELRATGFEPLVNTLVTPVTLIPETSTQNGSPR